MPKEIDITIKAAKKKYYAANLNNFKMIIKPHGNLFIYAIIIFLYFYLYLLISITLFICIIIYIILYLHLYNITNQYKKIQYYLLVYIMDFYGQSNINAFNANISDVR